jgi:Fic family protein
MEGDSLVLTVYRTKAAAVSTLVSHVFESLSNAERKGWEWLATRETTTSREYSEARGIPYRTAMNQLKRFRELGLLEKVGTGRSTKYIIHRS